MIDNGPAVAGLNRHGKGVAVSKTTFAIMTAVVLVAAVVAKEKKPKPWTEWSQKDAQKILNDSPWGQTQVEADLSEMFYHETTGRGDLAASRAERGAYNQAVVVNFRIRLLSAKPIRQAFARLIELQQKAPNQQLSDSLRGFADRRFDEWIVVAVDFDSKDARMSGPVMQVFNSANTGLLKNSTYLETGDGRRLFLQDYKAPINDGLGAKFIFPKTEGGEPFITPKSGELRFYSDIPKTITLNMRFKLADMMYDGILEY